MKSENFEITEEMIQEGIKLILRGRVNATNADELQSRLEEAINKGQTNVILNMLWVEYLCSAGIRVILKAYKGLQASGGRFGIETPSQNVKNVLGMVALNEMLIN